MSPHYQRLIMCLQFEGQQSFAKQKYAKTTGREIPVTRVKMARQVAEVVQAYFEVSLHLFFA